MSLIRLLNTPILRDLTAAASPRIRNLGGGAAAAADPEIISNTHTEFLGNSSTDPFVIDFPAAEVGDVVVMWMHGGGNGTGYYMTEDTTSDFTNIAASGDIVGGDNYCGNLLVRLVDGTEDATYGWNTAVINNKYYNLHMLVVRGADSAIWGVTPTTAHRDANFDGPSPPVRDITGMASGDLVVVLHGCSRTEVTTYAAPDGFTMFDHSLDTGPGNDCWGIAYLTSDGTAISGENWNNTVSSSLGEYWTMTLAFKTPPPPVAQSLIWERKGASTTLSNGGLTMEGTGGNWWYACGGDVQDSALAKTRASGGKWMFEVTIDSMPSSSAFAALGFGNDSTAGFDVILAGNTNGCTLLVDDENGTLSRMYYGSSSATQVTATSPAFPVDAGGSVFTMGIDLDADTFSAYMDGVAIDVDRTYVLNGAEDTEIIFMVKSFQAAVITLNTTVQYPISGYTVWA